MLLALSLGLVTAAANFLGSYLAVAYRHPPRIFLASSIAFGGGFLLAAALLELVPESVERGSSSMPVFIALGYLVVYLGEQLFNVHLHTIPDVREPDHAPGPVPLNTLTAASLLLPATALATLMAFNIHDFIDGLAIGAAMVRSDTLGVLAFLAVLSHELPAGFVIAAVIRASGRGRTTALLAGASIGVITLLGIAVPFWVGEVSEFAADAFLALAAGSFIYIGASILIPAVETGRSRLALVMVGLGFAVFYLTAQGVEALLPE